MNIILWILQVLLGLYFMGVGVMHFIIPPDLPATLAWMYELSPGLHYFSGTAEILGGLGLILPSVTKIKPKLTPLAGAGLVVVMLGAAVWHLTRGEATNIVLNLVNAAVLAFVAYGRWRLHPIGADSEAATS